MKALNCNTKRLLRNTLIVCACMCFPAVFQANTNMDLKIKAEKEAIAAEKATFAEKTEANAYEYTAVEMGKKTKNKKRRRHRSIGHMR